MFSAMFIQSHSQKEVQTEVYDMTVAGATGILNAALSRYSGNIIRVGHVTGASVDIGVLSGRHVMGQKENLWKIQILVMLVVMFWLGGVLVQWIDPLLDKAILFVNSAYMILVGIIYMLYWRLGGMEKIEKEALAKENAAHEFNATLVSPSDPRSESISNSSQGVTKAGSANTTGDEGLALESDVDPDFNLTKEEADRLRVTIVEPVTVNAPAAPATIQDRSGVEFTFIMIGASLLAGNSGCVNAISSLSSRVSFRNILVLCFVALTHILSSFYRDCSQLTFQVLRPILD